jgi:hypothetical protein
MLKTINNLICCKLCKQILKKPVVLPCGESICAIHEEQFKNKETAKCQLCDEEHFLNNAQNFLANKVVDGFLAGEISRLNFGKKHENTTQLLIELNTSLYHFDKLRSNPGDLIFEKFQAMRNKVDLIREKILQNVNECSEKIISDIDSYEEECKQQLFELESKLVSNSKFDLSKLRDELKEWDTNMNKLYFDETLCSEINLNCQAYSKSLEKTLNELKNEIFLGEEKKFEFETKYINIFETFYKHIGFNG